MTKTFPSSLSEQSGSTMALPSVSVFVFSFLIIGLASLPAAHTTLSV